MKTVTALLGLTLAFGCSGGAELTADDFGGTPTDEAAAESQTGERAAEALPVEGTLTYAEAPTGVEGSFQAGEALVSFRSDTLDDGVTDVVIELNGMVLATTIDGVTRVAELDGFAADEGGDTHMSESDRALLEGLYAALEARADRANGAADALVRSASIWAQTSDSLALQRSVAGDVERGWTSICGNFQEYLEAWHDDWSPCWSGPDSGDQCISLGKVGYRHSQMKYYVNSSWTTTVQDHKKRLYEKGQCFGNCGANCPSGNQTLTLDCHDHDQCVRNGHSLASAWCDDEFVAASDDEVFAPTCKNTSTN